MRDKLVKINLAMDGHVDYKVLTGDALNKALVEKLIEEAKELQNSQVSAGEIADLQELLDQIIKNHGLKKSDIKAKQTAKRAKNGGFKKGHFIKTLALPDYNEWANYYAADPKRFPEISSGVHRD